MRTSKEMIHMQNTTNVEIARQLIALGKALLGDAPVETAPVKETKAPKGKKAKKADAPEGLPFGQLRAILREHKVAGRVEGGVSVKQMIDAGRMDAFGNLTDEQAVVAVEAAEAPRKAKKAKKAKAERVVAEVETEAPAKERKPVSENHASQGPRDSLGRITPKVQWDLREALAMSAQFSREDIDRIVTDHFANA